MVAPDWLSLPLSEWLCTHVSFMHGVGVGGWGVKKIILISNTDAERESKFVFLLWKSKITVILLQSASAKR